MLKSNRKRVNRGHDTVVMRQLSDVTNAADN